MTQEAKPDVFAKTYQSKSLETPGKNFSQLKLKFLLAEQRWRRSFQKFRAKNAHVGVVSSAKGEWWYNARCHTP